MKKKIFEELEKRLKLRALLSRKKAEQFAKSIVTTKNEIHLHEKFKERKKILDNFQKQTKSI